MASLTTNARRTPGGSTYFAHDRHRRRATSWKLAELTPIGLHEAQHTFASLLIAAGVNPKAISTSMGHASVTITFDRYGHLMPGNEAEAAANVDVYLERADSSPRALSR